MRSSLFLRSYERRLIALLIVSFVALSTIVILHKGRFGDLQSFYTDHLHHSHATWAFLKKGFDVYRYPFGVIAAEVPYPQPAAAWPEFPVAYPPGFAGVFLLPTLIGRYWPMSMEAYGKVCIVYLLAVAYAGLYAVGIVIKGAGGARPVLLFLFWLLFTRCASLGFYDPAWMLCGAMSSRALRENRANSALVWFTAAAFTNLRAACMLPVGLVAAWRVARGPETRLKKALLLGGSGVLGLITCYTFRLFLAASPKPGSPLYESVTRPFSFEPEIVRTTLLWMTSAAFSSLALLAGNWLAAVTTVCTTLLTLQHGAHAWHSSMLIAPVLVAGKADPGKVRSVTLYGAVTVWCLIVFQLGFAHEPTLFLEELVAVVRSIRAN